MLTPLYPEVLTAREERLPNGYTFRMLSIPSGTVEIGNNEGEEEGMFDWESPRHPVTVPAFELAEFPVTQALWAAVRDEIPAAEWEQLELPAEPSRFRSAYRPVEQVSWWEAASFCTLLSKLSGRNYRLPTEAEWEYAARCGQRDKIYAGGNDLNEVGWYHRNNITKTMPVGLLAPNEWGLYDMSGNAWEWCSDQWCDRYKGAMDNESDGLSDEDFAGRVYRGGSWNLNARYCRAACRSREYPSVRKFNLGFRLAASSSISELAPLAKPPYKVRKNKEVDK